MARPHSFGLLVLGAAAACSSHDAQRFRQAWQEDRGAWVARLLDEVGEPAPRPGDRFVRFIWLRSFHDWFVFTAGFDEDVGFVRYVRRCKDTHQWSRPNYVFLEDAEVKEQLFEPPRGRHWENPVAVADGSTWVFEGVGWTAMRHSPEPGCEWFGYGLCFIRLAQVEVLAGEVY
jgi:hypothetical protein